jgi:hypothetical protein
MPPDNSPSHLEKLAGVIAPAQPDLPGQPSDVGQLDQSAQADDVTLSAPAAEEGSAAPAVDAQAETTLDDIEATIRQVLTLKDRVADIMNRAESFVRRHGRGLPSPEPQVSTLPSKPADHERVAALQGHLDSVAGLVQRTEKVLGEVEQIQPR